MEAARSVRSSRFVMSGIERHVAGLVRTVESVTTEEERRRARARLWVDLSCFLTILTQNARPVETVDGVEVWAYDPAYEPQRFGRITEIGGGLQSCSGAMKAAAREGVPGWHNYDLSSSQARLLVVLMVRAGVEPTWLLAYLADPGGKAAYASRVGVSVGTWKRALYAVLMGARAPSPNQLAFADGKLVGALWDEVGDGRLSETYGRFFEVTQQLREELGRWHDYLVDVWAVENGRYVAANEGTYVTNAVGSKVALEDLSPEGKRYELKAKLAALHLQGLEAAVVHRIAVSGDRYGFQVMSHEHDGLVTLGEIPREAVEEAARGAGVPLGAVVLVEKPFV